MGPNSTNFAYLARVPQGESGSFSETIRTLTQPTGGLPAQDVSSPVNPAGTLPSASTIWHYGDSFGAYFDASWINPDGGMLQPFHILLSPVMLINVYGLRITDTVPLYSSLNESASAEGPWPIMLSGNPSGLDGGALVVRTLSGCWCDSCGSHFLCVGLILKRHRHSGAWPARL